MVAYQPVRDEAGKHAGEREATMVPAAQAIEEAEAILAAHDEDTIFTEDTPAFAKELILQVDHGPRRVSKTDPLNKTVSYDQRERPIGEWEAES
jgi:hypothetical protein